MTRRATATPPERLTRATFTLVVKTHMGLPVTSAPGDRCPWPGPPRARSSASAPAREPVWRPRDIVDEWGVQSFPASDPPANW